MNGAGELVVAPFLALRGAAKSDRLRRLVNVGVEEVGSAQRWPMNVGHEQS
jgi:hypothetical protein